VQRARRHAEDRLPAGARAAAGLLDEEADRARLVEQPEPTRLRGILRIARIHEDAAPHQDAVRLGDHRRDPAHVEVLAARAGLAGQALIDIALDRRLPEPAVGRVDRELVGIGRDPDAGVRQHELAEVRIQRESGDPVADAEHEQRRRTVERIAGGDLGRARLQEVRLGDIPAAVDDGSGRAQDREDAADRHVDVDVARSVERIEDQQVLAARIGRRDLARFRHLLRCHAREVAVPLVHPDEDPVAQHVERLLDLSLDVDRAAGRCPGRRHVTAGTGAGRAVRRPAECRAERIAELAERDDPCDRLAGERDIQQQRIQIAARLREAAALLDKVSGQGPALRQGHDEGPGGRIRRRRRRAGWRGCRPG